MRQATGRWHGRSAQSASAASRRGRSLPWTDRAIAVLQTVLREALDEGRTVLMSTHQLREALELATHVALINRGMLAFAGERTREMVEDPGWIYPPLRGGVMQFFARP